MASLVNSEGGYFTGHGRSSRGRCWTYSPNAIYLRPWRIFCYFREGTVLYACVKCIQSMNPFTAIHSMAQIFNVLVRWIAQNHVFRNQQCVPTPNLRTVPLNAKITTEFVQLLDLLWHGSCSNLPRCGFLRFQLCDWNVVLNAEKPNWRGGWIKSLRLLPGGRFLSRQIHIGSRVENWHLQSACLAESRPIPHIYVPRARHTMGQTENCNGSGNHSLGAYVGMHVSTLVFQLSAYFANYECPL